MAQQRPKESDVRRRTGLTAGLLAPARGAGPSGASGSAGGASGAGSGGAGGSGSAEGAAQSSEEYLQQTEDELNTRVDGGVVALADGFMDLFKLASSKGKNAFTSSEEAFQMDLRVQNMVRQTQTLMSLSHTLKMLLLTADATSPDRDQQLSELSQRSSDDRKEVVQLLSAIAQRQQQQQSHQSQVNGVSDQI